MIATPYIYLIAYKGITQPTIWQVKTATGKEVIEEQMQRSEEIEKEIHEKQKIQKTGTVSFLISINGVMILVLVVLMNLRFFEE